MASLTIAGAVREEQRQQETETEPESAQAFVSSEAVSVASVAASSDALAHEEEEYMEALSPLTFSTTELTLEVRRLVKGWGPPGLGGWGCRCETRQC